MDKIYLHDTDKEGIRDNFVWSDKRLSNNDICYVLSDDIINELNAIMTDYNQKEIKALIEKLKSNQQQSE